MTMTLDFKSIGARRVDFEYDGNGFYARSARGDRFLRGAFERFTEDLTLQDMESIIDDAYAADLCFRPAQRIPDRKK